MDFDVSTKKVFCLENSEEKKAVLPVECSMILPDYFPDVMKILRYTAKTVKSPVFSENGTDTVSGNVNIEVNYVSEEGELCSCSQLQPFSHSFESAPNTAMAEAEIKVGEIGCRAINKRRIDLHGSIEILLRTLCGEEKNFVSAISGAGAVCREKTEEITVPVGDFYKTFSLDEKGELGYGKPHFGKVIRSSAFAKVTECHVIQDKIVTKGEVKVDVLWKGEPEGENDETGPFLSCFSFPVSRMVDAPGILLTDICDAGYSAEFPEVSPADDGQNISIKVKIGIFARVYRKNFAEYITDMFSCEYETKAEKESLSVIKEAVPVSLTENIFEKLELPESAEKVTDIWAETSDPFLTTEGKIAFETKICMFAKDEDGESLYFEKKIEKEISSPVIGKNAVFYNISAETDSCEFSLGRDKTAEISASVLIDGTVYVSKNENAISFCAVETDKAVLKENAAVILCFAEKGEQLWDIAKRYRSPMGKIMEENGLSNEVLSEKTMLVISG